MKMYTALAEWWPLLSPPEDYADEATFFLLLMREAASRPGASLLELGSGGGNNATHLKSSFAEVVLSDLAPEMLAVSSKLNPECKHVAGDMRTLRLNRQFDAVFIHDAIDYMTSLEDLRQALATASAHCKPGGVTVIAPDDVRETFESATEHGGEDGEDGRGIRYLEWSYDPDPSDSLVTTDYIFAVRQTDQTVTVIHDQHLFGLFSTADWLNTLREVGFQAESVTDSYGRVVFVAHKL